MTDENTAHEEQDEKQLDLVEDTAAIKEEGENQEDMEHRARIQGWRPKDEFRGDGGAEWIDAKEFLERAEKNNPMLRAQNRQLTDKIEQMQQAMLDMKDMMSTNQKRAYDKARGDLEAEMAKAKEDYDMESYDKANKQLQELEKEKPAENPVTQNIEDPELARWLQDPRNNWYFNDREMGALAEAQWFRINQEHPYASTPEKLAEVERAVRKYHPEKFGVREKPSYPSVEGGRSARASGGKKSYQDIPSESRVKMDSFLKGLKDTWAQRGMDIATETKKYKESCVKEHFGE